MNLAVSFVISGVLLVLFVMLLVTSFNAVKRHMHAKTWKNVQRWAYVFFGLMYVHLAVILMPPALSGKETAMISMTVYTIVFAAYAILRIRRTVVEMKKARDL